MLLRLYGEREMVRRHFRATHGRDPELECPRTFNEKLAWSKIYVRNPLMVQCADKYAVRQYVRNTIGEEYLVPLIGVYGEVRDIPFDQLPRQFVLKATHGSGCNILCRDKTLLNTGAANQKLRRWLRLNYYYFGYEWAYRDVPPQIICEHLLLDERNKVPKDYKVFCFNGEPLLIQVDLDRFEDHRRSIYDASWTLQPFTYTYPLPEYPQAPPRMLHKMLACARTLSRPFAFVRVDFYAIGQRVYCGEMTFYPEGGCGRMEPEEYDYRVGAMLNLNDPATVARDSTGTLAG
jgi:hypothetical protein